VQLISDERGAAIAWVMVLSTVVFLTGFLALETQHNSARVEVSTQAYLDLVILRSSLVEILKDPTFCASAMGVAMSGGPVVPGSATNITLTQVLLVGSATPVIQTNSYFNLLKISSIQLTGLSLVTANQYTGNFHVVATLPAQVYGTSSATMLDIPMTISSAPLGCTGGP
jgi:hypothetical protein